MATSRTHLKGNDLRKDSVTGSSAISLSVAAIKTTKVVSVTLHLNAAPTTSENLTIKLNANAGAAYDTTLYSLDLSAGSTVDLLWQPNEEIYLEQGDSLDIAYTNTDGRTYGLQVTTLEMV